MYLYRTLTNVVLVTCLEVLAVVFHGTLLVQDVKTSLHHHFNMSTHDVRMDDTIIRRYFLKAFPRTGRLLLPLGPMLLWYQNPTTNEC
jgi:hypothetical protein